MATNKFEDWDETDLPYAPTDVTVPSDIELHESTRKT